MYMSKRRFPTVMGFMCKMYHIGHLVLIFCYQLKLVLRIIKFEPFKVQFFNNSQKNLLIFPHFCLPSNYNFLCYLYLKYTKHIPFQLNQFIVLKPFKTPRTSIATQNTTFISSCAHFLIKIITKLYITD